MRKSPCKRNKLELQPIIVENGPNALANPMRNLRPTERPGDFTKFNIIPHLINHPNRNQLIHDIAFPNAMDS